MKLDTPLGKSICAILISILLLKAPNDAFNISKGITGEKFIGKDGLFI